MAVIIPVVSKFDDKGLKSAQSEFGKLGKTMKGLIGAVGLSVGLSAIVSGLKESAVAASEDVKSQALLAQQLKNTVGATNSQVASVEASIKAMQNQAAVADDQIRPAFASLVRSTGDIGEATRLTTLALDVAAGTGKDLGTVSIALGKAVNGSTTSLQRLIPSIKGASDPIAFLTKQFDGAAEAAANNDPMKRLQILFQDMQEQIGMYLLPALQDLANYFASPDGQQNIEDFATSVGDITTSLIDLGTVLKNSGISGVLGSIFNGLHYTVGLLAGDQKVIDQLINTAAGVSGAAPKKISKGLTAAEKTALANSLKTGGNNYASSTTVADTKAAAAKTKAAKDAAAKAAKEQQAIIDASKKAAEAARQAFTDLKTSVDDFNKSFEKTASEFTAVFKMSSPMGEFEQKTVDAFDSIKQSAQDAFDSKLITAKALSDLNKYADQEATLLRGIAKQRDVLAKKISIAQSVTNGVMGSLNLTSMLESETKQVTKSVTSMVNGIALTTTQTFDEVVSGGLADSFKKLVDKTKTFAANLIKLKELGLNGNLFKQIVDAGAESGNATAEAIIAGGASAVTELNGLFKELTDAGASIAETATPVMYDLGDEMTNSFIDGLRSEDQKLIDTATAMAALFTESFKSALGSAILPTLNASGVTAGLGMDNTDYIRGVGRVTSSGTTPTGQPITINVNAGMIASKQEIPGMIVDALGTYTKQSGAGGLTRVLGL